MSEPTRQAPTSPVTDEPDFSEKPIGAPPGGEPSERPDDDGPPDHNYGMDGF